MVTGTEPAGVRQFALAVLAALVALALGAAVVAHAWLSADDGEAGPGMDIYLEEHGIRLEMTTSFADERSVSQARLHAAGVTTVAEMWPSDGRDHDGASPASLHVAAGSSISLVGWVEPDCATTDPPGITFSVVAEHAGGRELVEFHARDARALAPAVEEWCRGHGGTSSV